MATRALTPVLETFDFTGFQASGSNPSSLNQIAMLSRHLTRASGRLRRQYVRYLATSDESETLSILPSEALPSCTTSKPRKKKTFQFSAEDDAEETVPLEEFEYPSYWDVDYPSDFDNEMKHEVEKLQIFADFTPYMDLSWQQQIHPLFDGTSIRMTLTCPLEDFDERLFINDRNTYDTKVVMEVPMTCFKGLNKEAKDLVTQLAGPRYHANKKMLKIAEDRYNTRVFNHKRICDILRDLTQTACELSGQANETDKPKKDDK